MSEEVFGKVIEIASDRYARYVVIEQVTPNGYTRRVACRFHGEKRLGQIVGVMAGMQVKIVGGAESVAGKGNHAGKWFTNFEAFRCERVPAGQ